MKRFHSFRLDPVNECLWRDLDGEHVRLTRKAFAVLNHLVGRAGRLVTKDELMEAVWPGTYVQEEILKSYVRKLRQVLGDDARSPSFIATQTGRGYRFIAPVTEDLCVAPDAVAVQVAKPLFGRDVELGTLRGWYERALRAERQVVFITGEPGIGKTSLVEAFLRQTAADTGACIATGQCIETFHRQEAYYPVLEAVGRLCQAPHAPHVVELLARHAPTWLVQFPSLMTASHRESLQREILGATRERMLRELSGALEAISATMPVVLVLEDLHWADHGTLDLIAALARRHEPARLLLLATYRPVEVILSEHPLKRLKHELGIQRRSQELALDLLSKTAVAEYLAARFPGRCFSADFAELIHQQTDGNPLFMVTAAEYLVAHGLISRATEGGRWELNVGLDHVRSSVPKSLQQTIEGQIDRLTADEREILQVASLEGVEFTSRMVAAGLRRDTAGVEACCDSLARRQWLLREVGPQEFPDGSYSARYQFTHSLYREVLYRTCGRATKVRLHQRLGEELERAAAGSSDIASELARHFQEGHDYARAVRYLQVAAATATRRYAYREAVAILQSAHAMIGNLPEAARGRAELDILEQLATVRDMGGERATAAECYQALAQRAAQLGDSETEARALINLGHQLRWSSVRPALATYERAAQIGVRLGSTPLQADAEANACFLRLGVLGWRQEWADALKGFVDWMADAGELARFALNARISAHVRMSSGDYEGAERVASRGKSVAIEIGAAASYFYCCGHCGWSLTGLGQLGEALNNLRDAVRMAERHGDGLFGAYVKLVLADLHCQAFDFATARALCEEALCVVQGSGFTHALEWALVNAAAAETGLGDYDKALEHVAALQALYERGEVLFSWYWQMPMHAVACEAGLARGDLRGARQEAERLRALSEQTADRPWQARCCQLQARVALAEGNATLAQGEVAAALGLIDGLTAPLAAWRIYETAADVNELMGQNAPAQHYLELRNATLLGLANSLTEEEPLRRSILGAIATARLQRSRA